MFGLWFAIFGLISGVVCSYEARKKGLPQKIWYTLGQLLPVISVMVLFTIDNQDLSSEEENNNEDHIALNGQLHPTFINK
jgi:hypothetical protein